MLNTWQFHHQATRTKNKCIDRVYIEVIERRIQDRMDKMTMNRPLDFIYFELAKYLQLDVDIRKVRQ